MSKYYDSMDFSERRPEEVISFIWRSVYMNDGAIYSFFKCFIVLYYCYEYFVLFYIDLYGNLCFVLIDIELIKYLKSINKYKKYMQPQRSQIKSPFTEMCC